nr:hypothetical protein HmN_000791000 [Hymenolepis microstoma]
MSVNNSDPDDEEIAQIFTSSSSEIYVYLNSQKSSRPSNLLLSLLSSLNSEDQLEAILSDSKNARLRDIWGNGCSEFCFPRTTPYSECEGSQFVPISAVDDQSKDSVMVICGVGETESLPLCSLPEDTTSDELFPQTVDNDRFRIESTASDQNITEDLFK